MKQKSGKTKELKTNQRRKKRTKERRTERRKEQIERRMRNVGKATPKILNEEKERLKIM